MTVRTKLLVNIFSWLSFFLIFFVVLNLVTSKVENAVRMGALSGRIVVGASEMSSIIYDYLLNPGDRARRQWELKHASLRLLIAEMRSENRNNVTLDQIRKNHIEISILFQQLVENSKKRDVPASMQPMIEENSARITAGLVARSQMMVNDAYLLSRAVGAEITAVQSAYFGILHIVLAVITMTAIAISFFSARDIAHSIERLRAGTETLAASALDYRVPVKGKDEIAALSRAFNQMADRLRDSYLSLQDEIRKKEKAREETRIAYAELEKRVVERTREISVINRELMRSQEKLKATVQELESFSYSVSHDLRAPLRAIDGFSNMLMKELGDRLEGDARRKLNIIGQNVMKMNQLIDDLLAFSRLGRKDMAMADIDMERLFEIAWNELTVITPGRKIELRKKPLPAAYGDPALIKQVISNLLSNAVKFTGIRDIARIEIGGAIENAETAYYVKDNGAGFDMRYYDRLFGVFQRLHSESEFEGTGVGLAIVQRIIHRHGGRVWAEGETGKGAAFYFSLPVKRE